MKDLRMGPLVGGAAFDDETLRRLMAQDAVHAGRLPPRPADRMWGSTADDAICTICSLAISSQEPGYELQFSADGGDWAVHFLHVPCFAAWETECRNGNHSDQANGHDDAALANGHVNGHKRGSPP